MKKIIALLLMSIVVLFGCSSSSSGEKTIITFATPDTGPAVEFYQSLVDQYNASQDEVEVQLQAYGSSFDQKLTASAGTSDAPDVVKMWNYSAYSNILLPLDDYIATMEDYDDFYPALWNYSQVDGVNYGVPFGFSTRAIYVNEAKLEEAGITIDPYDWSMQEFADAAKATGADGTGFYQFYDNMAYQMEQFLWTWGSEGWLKEDGTSNLTDPLIAECLQFFHDMIYVDGSVKLNNSSNANLEVDFVTGTYTFAEFGVWLAPAIAESMEDFAVYPLPGKDGGTGYSTIHASSLAITKDCEDPDAAWDFIMWMTAPEQMEQIMKYELPVRQSLAEEKGLTTDPIYGPYYHELETSEAHQTSMNKTSNWAEISSIISKAIETIFMTEDVDIPQVLAEAEAEINEL